MIWKHNMSSSSHSTGSSSSEPTFESGSSSSFSSASSLSSSSGSSWSSLTSSLSSRSSSSRSSSSQSSLSSFSSSSSSSKSSSSFSTVSQSSGSSSSRGSSATSGSSSSRNSSSSSYSSVSSPSSGSSKSSLSSLSSSSISSLSSESSFSTSSGSSSSMSSQSSSSLSSQSSSSSSSVVEKMEFYFASIVPSQVSLAIDILNKNDLKSSTKNWFGYPKPPEINAIDDERFRGNLLYKEAIWGFLGLNKGYNSHISNGVVFAGDTISIKIAPLGHAVGYLASVLGQLVFCKTTLEITLYDIGRGSRKTLIFDNFQSSLEDISRFIIWKVASINDEAKQLYQEKGFYGLYVIETKEINKWYYNPDWTNEVSLPSDMKSNCNTSFLQIFSLWWKNSLAEIDISNPVRNISVLQNANFITSPISINDNKTTTEIFDENTSFPSYKYISGGQPVDITNEEKDKIIKGNAWNMAGSQLPILTADYKNQKLLGLGITEPSANPKTDYFPYVRNTDFENESLGTKELYNLNGVPVAYNLHNYLADITGNHLQSSSKIYNPNRCVWMNKSNQNGEIGFITSSMLTVGSELIGENMLEKTIYTKIDRDIPRIENITSETNENNIVIEFNVANGENKIYKISYSFAVDNYGYRTYVDETGKTRRVEFQLYKDFKEIITPYSIVNIRIGLEDDSGNIYYYYHNHNLATIYNSCINNLRAWQRTDGSHIVDLFYDYLSYTEISPAKIELKISSDYGQTYAVPITSAMGDIGNSICTGNNRHIIWKPWVDLPNFMGSGVVFQIIGNSIDDSYIIGRNVSGNVVIDGLINKPHLLLQNKDQEKYGIYDEEEIKEDGIFSFEEESEVWISSLSTGSSSMGITSSSWSSATTSSISSISSSSSLSSVSSSSLSSISNSSSLSSVSSSSLSSVSSSSLSSISNSSSLSSVSSSSLSSVSSSSLSSVSSSSLSSASSVSSNLCPNSISELTTTIRDDIVFTYDRKLALTINDFGGVNKDNYIILYSGDTGGQSYDNVNKFYGDDANADPIVANGYCPITINSGTYYMPVYSGTNTTDCCSNLTSPSESGTFTFAGYALIKVNGNLLLYTPIYIS